MKLKGKVYLAGPFFNPEQRARISELEEVLEGLGLDVYSPSRDGKKLNIGESTYEERLEVFTDNVVYIDRSDLVVAIGDFNDTGTWFEIGYAESIHKPVIVFSKFVRTPDLDGVMNVYSIENVVSSVESVLGVTRILLIESESDDIVPELIDQFEDDDRVRFSVVRQNDLLEDPELRSLVVTNSDLIIASIDDRPVASSHMIGSIYGSRVARRDKLPRVVTYSTQNFGVNLMLLHSITKHFQATSEGEVVDDLFDYIKDVLSNDGELIYDDQFAKEVIDFE